MYHNEQQTEKDFAQFRAAFLSAMENQSTHMLSYMDLHGMSVEQAKAYVFMHVRNACSQGMGLCRIITGRGNHINARGERGVLFELCEQWLQSEELKPLIERYEKKIGHYIVTLNSLNNEISDIEKNEAFCAKYLENLEAKAVANDPEAQYQLACCYSTGIGTLKRDLKTAFKWYLAAASQDHERALGQVGHAYLIGEGVRQSDKLAIEWLTKAANKKQARPAYTLSSIYLWGWGTKINHPSAIAWAAKSANWGDVMGMRRVGGFFTHGTIAQKNEKKAFEWYFKAAQLGDAYSQYQVGIFLHEGMGIAIDKKKSFDWILLSAQGGDTDGMMMVGQFYLVGDGCQKEVEAGLTWLKKSAALGNAHAGLLLGEYYLKQDKKEEALTFFQESAERGSILAQMKLLHLKRDVPNEQDKVLALLIEQSTHEIEKLAPAQQMALGSLMLNPAKSKRKTKQNQQKGVILLEAAAKKGQVSAYNELGYYFAQTHVKRAAQYWEKAAKADNLDAMFMLGLSLELYLQKPQEAERWFKKAIKGNHPGALLRLGIKKVFEETWNDETFKGSLNYLTLALEEAKKQVVKDAPDFVCSFRVLYKVYHAIGVFLIYTRELTSQQEGERYKKTVAAYDYYKQSALMGYHKAQFDLGIALVSNQGTFQEGIEWLTKAATQNDARAKDAMALYQQFSHLPEIGLDAFNFRLKPIIQHGSADEKIGFSKADFTKIVAEYFGDNADLHLPDKSKKKGKAPAEEPQPDTVQHAKDTHLLPSSSELIMKHSALFQREPSETACSNGQETATTEKPPQEESASASNDTPLEQEENRSWCSIQ